MGAPAATVPHMERTVAPSKVLRLLLAPLADLESVLGFFFIDRLAYGLSEVLLAATNRCGDFVA